MSDYHEDFRETQLKEVCEQRNQRSRELAAYQEWANEVESLLTSIDKSSERAWNNWLGQRDSILRLLQTLPRRTK